MPIPLDVKIRKTATVSRLTETLKDNDTDWMAWWYCGLYKNPSAQSQPSALVAFRKLLKEGSLSDETIYRRVPLTALGQVRVGSIWNGGVSQFSAVYEESDFDVNFQTTGWRFTSFSDALGNNSGPPFPRDIYPLHYKTDQNWLIEFALPTGGKLIIPCLEFFTRCYGRSEEINRILATYTWDEVKNRFYAPLDEPEEPGKWKVKLRKRLRNGDTVLLAHTKYDLYTEKRAKEIHSQIEELYSPESTKPIFIKIAPWFQGPAEIRCRGIWFNNHRSFLALQVSGSSDPDGILIERDRENSHKREPGDPANKGGVAWDGSVESRLVRPPEIVDLTGGQEPDHGSDNVEIQDPSFVLLGIPRTIVDRYGKKVTSRSGVKRKGDEASAYSSGDQYGTGKGVGYASIHAQPIMESHGALMDMWNAMLHLQKAHPNTIQSVEWFTFEHGYKTGESPHLIALEHWDDEVEEALPTQTRNWLFYDVAAETPRGVMVARLIVKGIHVHIVELQRRPRKKRNQKNQEVEGEESFKGFVVITAEEAPFVTWLKRFLSDVRYVRGIVQKLVPYCPEKADAFKHPKENADQLPGEPAVLNALGKMGITL